MVVRVRLARFGRRHAPFYNIVIANSRKPLEVIGTYDPIPKIPQDDESGRKYKDIFLDKPRAKYWLGVGAQPSDTAWRLLAMAGLLEPKYTAQASKTSTQKAVDPLDKLTPADIADEKLAELRISQLENSRKHKPKTKVRPVSEQATAPKEITDEIRAEREATRLENAHRREARVQKAREEYEEIKARNKNKAPGPEVPDYTTGDRRTIIRKPLDWSQKATGDSAADAERFVKRLYRDEREPITWEGLVGDDGQRTRDDDEYLQSLPKLPRVPGYPDRVMTASRGGILQGRGAAPSEADEVDELDFAEPGFAQEAPRNISRSEPRRSEPRARGAGPGSAAGFRRLDLPGGKPKAGP